MTTISRIAARMVKSAAEKQARNPFLEFAYPSAPQQQQGGGGQDMSWIMDYVKQLLEGDQGQTQQPEAAQPQQSEAVQPQPAEQAAAALPERGWWSRYMWDLPMASSVATPLVSPYLSPLASKVLPWVAPSFGKLAPFLPYAYEAGEYLTGNAPNEQQFRQATTFDTSKGFGQGVLDPLSHSMWRPTRSIRSVATGLGLNPWNREESLYNMHSAANQNAAKANAAAQARQQAQQQAQAFSRDQMNLMGRDSAGYYFDKKHNQYMPTQQTFYQEGTANVPQHVQTWRQRVLKSAPGWKPESAQPQPVAPAAAPVKPVVPKPPQM